MARRGILSYDSVIADINVVVDRYPSEDGVAIVLDRSWSTGGPAYNAPTMLRWLDPGFPAEIQSLIGDDSNGAVVRRSLEQAGIENRRMRWTREAEQCHTEVMSSQASGRRTFFVRFGAAAMLGPEHLDLRDSDARLCHCGACGLHARLDAGKGPDAAQGWVDVLSRAGMAGTHTNMEMVSLDAPVLRRLARPCLPLLDSVIVNEVEAEAVTGIAARRDGKLDWGDAAAAACQALCALGVRQLAAVHFPEGGVAAAGRGGSWKQPSVRWPRARRVSAVGCATPSPPDSSTGCMKAGRCSRALNLPCRPPPPACPAWTRPVRLATGEAALRLPGNAGSRHRGGGAAQLPPSCTLLPRAQGMPAAPNAEGTGAWPT